MKLHHLTEDNHMAYFHKTLHKILSETSRETYGKLRCALRATNGNLESASKAAGITAEQAWQIITKGPTRETGQPEYDIDSIKALRRLVQLLKDHNVPPNIIQKLTNLHKGQERIWKHLPGQDATSAIQSVHDGTRIATAQLDTTVTDDQGLISTPYSRWPQHDEGTWMLYALPENKDIIHGLTTQLPNHRHNKRFSIRIPRRQSMALHPNIATPQLSRKTIRHTLPINTPYTPSIGTARPSPRNRHFAIPQSLTDTSSPRSSIYLTT